MIKFSRVPASLFVVAATLVAQLLLVTASAQKPTPPPVAARSWLVLAVTGRETLAANDPDMRVDPASLTKIMSAYLSFEALKDGRIKASDMINPSEKAWRTPGSRMFIEPNRPVSVDDLLHGMIVQSGNDATVALAEAVSGSEETFVEQMNKKAALFGMSNTQYRNASGLPDPNHYTTAKDLATLASRLITDFPQFFPIYSQREFEYNKIKQPNRNRLLFTDPTVDGLKTGHTESAGFCLIATAKRPLATPAGKAGATRRVLTVVLGTASDNARAQESQKLLNWAYQNFDTVRLLEAKAPVQTIPIFKGVRDEIETGVADDVVLTVPRGMADKLKATVERSGQLVAPVTVGQQVGIIKVTLDGANYRDVPLVALGDVPQAGVFGRAIDTIKLWFK
ncbi:D-alanyl-D-alanine carboxypeptidase family protein [soil metagenome]